MSSFLNEQEQLQSVVESEENRFVEAKIKIAEIQQIMMKVPQYKQKLLQVEYMNHHSSRHFIIFANTNTHTYLLSRATLIQWRQLTYNQPNHYQPHNHQPHNHQVRKEMGNIQRRCNKLSSKSEQLRGVRNKIRREEELEAEKLAKLEARVVSTTRPPKSGGASPVGGAKVAVVNE